MLPIPKRRCVSADVKPMVMRMLDAFDDVPEFVSLKKILLRPFFVDSAEQTADTIEKLNSLPRDCCPLRIFDALLSHLTLEEKSRHLAPLVEMFKFLLPRQQSGFRGNLSHLGSVYKYLDRGRFCVSNFLTLYVEAVRGAEDEGTSGQLVRFVEYVLGTIPVELDSLLWFMDTNTVEYLLTCFSDERFHAWGIRESGLLVHSLRMKEMLFAAVLIRHGFKYSFQENYYSCLKQNFSFGVRRRQNGFRHAKLPPLKSGNLRTQMAVEILVYLLCGVMNLHQLDGPPSSRPWMNRREFLCMLWQSVPYPFHTPDELCHLMMNVQGSVLEDACERYCTLIPGMSPVKQPRSLKHLARVRIRESMVRAHSIGEKAVLSLDLPKTLQDYLWKLEAF